jgi:retinol dehydrogenase-12
MKLNDFDFSKTASMAGKVFLVTGGVLLSLKPHLESNVLRLTLLRTPSGTSGIGKQTVLALARHPSPPSSIWFTGRSSSRAESVIAQCPPGVNVNFLEMDLASFDSIKYGVRQLLLKETVLDVLILNAGVMDVPNARTKDGYEIQFGTNYLAGGYLTQLLLPKLLHSPAPRVANVVSDACLLGQKIGIDFDSLKSDGKEVGYRVLNGFVLYARSKFGQLLWGQQLAKRYPQVTVINLHPGPSSHCQACGLRLLVWSCTLTSLVRHFARFLSGPQRCCQD